MLDKCEICSQVAMKRQYQELRPKETLYLLELDFLDIGKITLPIGGEEISLMAINHFTKWIKVKVVAQETSIAIETFVKEYIIYRHGCPNRVQTNGERPYMSNLMREFFKENNIKYMITVPYYPKSNGTVEQVIRIIKNVMKKVRLGGRQLGKEHYTL